MGAKKIMKSIKFSSLKNTIVELKSFLILWLTQGLSGLGSAMTSFALTLWLYEQTGSALKTSLLGICSYAPYILMSIFAGALSDRWNKKITMLVCDTLAACSTVAVLLLYINGWLRPFHLYILNAINGLMNTVQQPASEVATTLLIQKKYYQKTGALADLSRSVISILNPILATAIFSLAGLKAVIYIDFITFVIAFISLALFIKIPEIQKNNIENQDKESMFTLVKEGILWLKDNGLVFSMIIFMSGVNLVASTFDAVLPAFVLPKPNGGEKILGIVTSCSGIAMILGSLLAGILPKPKNRVKVVYITMLFSLGTENFLLAFCRSPILWCIGQIIGWILVPVMAANQNVVMRTTIPPHIQGRIYACRNTFQFFTIPIGYFLGGALTDKLFEPFMETQNGTWLNFLFGQGKGSGASMYMFVLGVLGIAICLILGRIMNRYTFEEK